MRTEQKQSIQSLVIEHVEHLGGQRATATKAGVSTATISQIINGKWDLIADNMWRKIAAALGHRADGWNLVGNIFNNRVLETTFADAKTHSMFVCVSHKAGSGKSAGCNLFFQQHKRKHVYLIRCREWSVRQFLSELCRTLGIDQPRGYVSADALLAEVVDFFLVRAEYKPLLIIDEADKLKGTALRTLIPLYNETEDRLGVVILGTENLSEEIKRGVRYNKKGYDEIDSRLGRQFVRLYGASEDDVRKICAANGIENKTMQKTIWKECNPKDIAVGGRFLPMIDDLRRLKRVVQRELIAMQEVIS
jgi:DNA transposition AAA+ family ATPase